MDCPACGANVPADAICCAACSTPTVAPNVTAEKPVANADPLRLLAQRVWRDAWSSLRMIANDPVGGLSVAHARLETPDRRRAVGIVFAVATVAFIFVGVQFGVPKTLTHLAAGGLGFVGLIKVIVIAMVPFGTVGAALAGARMLVRQPRSFESDVLVAGAVTLPVGVAALLSGVVGMANVELVFMFAVVAVALMVLLLYGGSSRVGKFSERCAAWFVPISILLAMWVTKVVGLALFT